jgi:16S rRNA (cytosine1402-N4)-methyltransferase
MNVAPDEFFSDPEPPSGPSARPLSHVPVLGDEVVAAFRESLSGPPVIIDATLGRAGHSLALLEALPEARLIGIDRDDEAISAARERLAPFGERVQLVHAPFSEVENVLAELGEGPVQGLLADFGVSSPQLDDSSRGMSFRHEGPLDMRMDRSSGETALELIARLSAEELADVIYGYGEERRSRRIARCVHQAFRQGELKTTFDLRRAVVRAVGPARVGGVDPATRTFQALRIAVNGELQEIEALLDAAYRVLGGGGVFAAISFHSLEDRLVKRAFLDADKWERITHKPVTASRTEAEQNPRSRSAKLRIARRVEQGGAP